MRHAPEGISAPDNTPSGDTLDTTTQQTPAREQSRLAALHALHVLDTPAEGAFERITDLTVHIFGTDSVAISLVDEHRQWFKSRRGLLDCSETPRAWAFCDHTIRQRGLFEVLEPTRDPRFADNPLVTAGPQLRYYAGVPLIVGDGHAVGTLCLLDKQPRSPLDERGQAILSDLAALVVRELEIRQTLRQSLALLSVPRRGS